MKDCETGKGLLERCGSESAPNSACKAVTSLAFADRSLNKQEPQPMSNNLVPGVTAATHRNSQSVEICLGRNFIVSIITT
jgi:hypothetical protein